MKINRQTYEEFFLLYNDGELSMEEKKAVEEFIRENPDLEQELILLQNVMFSPDESIEFEDKESLYRHEDRKILTLPWYRVAVAAILLIAFGFSGWLYFGNLNDAENQTIASKDNSTGNSDHLKPVDPGENGTRENNLTSTNEVVDAKERQPDAGIITVQQFEGKAKRKSASPTPVETITHTVNKVAVRNYVPESIEPEQEVVPQIETGEIDVEVAPRDISMESIALSAHEQEPVNTDPATITYVAAEEDDMIYFANTSLPKKSKLRGVFRKATRILDRVTSIQ